jgi:sterol 22-desaturase
MASSLLRRHSSPVPSPSFASSPLVDIPVSSFFAPKSTATWLFTTLAILGALLVLEQSVYRYKKKHLPGATWTIPVIGKFADSMKPTMEGYMAQWNSEALCAISVFNMYVASSYTRHMIVDTFL